MQPFTFKTLEHFNEPSYPVVRRECFDENIIKGILADDRFSMQDRKTASAYYKRKSGAGNANVIYNFASGCEEQKLGRLYPERNLGFANWSWTMRNPLAEKYYWDIDIGNAHYKIALKYCEDYKIPHANIRDYCENRDEKLKMVCPESREKAKLEFLKTLYGEKPKDYGFYVNDVDGVITLDGYNYIKGLKAEIFLLMHTVWEKHPQFHNFKSGKTMIKSKNNPHASLMALIFQTEERKMLMCLNEYLRINNRYMGVFIHDGGYVEKLETEKEFPTELLEGGAKTIKQFLGYNVKIENKKITHSWVERRKDVESYSYKKMKFEKHNALVGSTFVCKHKDGTVEFMNERQASVKFGNMILHEHNNNTMNIDKIPFIKKYIEDDERTEYDKVDFNPDPNFDNKRIFNLFDGFEVEKIKEKIVIDESKIEEKISIFKEHLYYLTSGYEDFLIKWLAFIVQTPHQRTEVAILLRDQAGLFSEGGGTGKNQFFERLIKHLLGEKYAYFVDDNEELYNSFNSMFEGKLFIFVEEAAGKANHQNSDTLKSKITKKKLNVNRKSVAQYVVNDFSNMLLCTNNLNPVPIQKGDRRWATFDVNPIMRGDKEYFKELVEALEDTERIQYFYYYLKYKVKTYKNAFELSNNVPVTDAYREIRNLNAPGHLKFFVHLVKQGELKNSYYGCEFYDQYKLWYCENKPGKEAEMLSPTAFGIILKKNDNEIEIDNKRDAKGMHYYIDIPKVIKGLQRIKMLENDFCYDPK